eukprot:1329291-Amphidinium_carterae.1
MFGCGTETPRFQRLRTVRQLVTNEDDGEIHALVQSLIHTGCGYETWHQLNFQYSQWVDQWHVHVTVAQAKQSTKQSIRQGSQTAVSALSALCLVLRVQYPLQLSLSDSSLYESQTVSDVSKVRRDSGCHTVCSVSHSVELLRAPRARIMEASVTQCNHGNLHVFVSSHCICCHWSPPKNMSEIIGWGDHPEKV